MTYLLDVNVLVALGFQQHEFHGPGGAVGKEGKSSPFCYVCHNRIGFCKSSGPGAKLWTCGKPGPGVAVPIEGFRFFALDYLSVTIETSRISQPGLNQPRRLRMVIWQN